ncbi:MAG: hypothetical protein ACI9F9_000119 [Candidatus Paceibacteria bacterium]|jgi:hypothetical protein
MKTSCTRLGLYLLGWLMLFGVAKTDVWRETWAQESGASPEVIQSARARWDSLSATEQAQLQRRFERLQQLDSGEREVLKERTRRNQKIEKRVMSELSEQDRGRVQRLPRDRRREVMAELVEEERRDKGRRLESKLPSSVRAWMKQASPKERAQRLEMFKTETRRRISVRAVENLAQALGYGEEEVRRLERLPLDRRMATVLRLQKRLTTQQLKEHGLPRGLSQERWDALNEKSAEEFLRDVWQLQNRGVLEDVLTFDRTPRADEHKSVRRALHEVRRAMRVDSAALVELSELTPRKRHKQVQHIRRSQVSAALRKSELVSEEEWPALDAMDDAFLLSSVRTIMEERQAVPSSRGSTENEDRKSSSDEQ